MYHLILAGGYGIRFWPRSRKELPKQLCKILEDRSMMRSTFLRVLRIARNLDHIFILAPKDMESQIRAEVPELGQKNYIAEPSAQNTAAAIGLAAIHMMNFDENATMAVYPSDHHLGDAEALKSAVLYAEKWIQTNDELVVLGVPAKSPETNLGYMQMGSAEGLPDEMFQVSHFVEKPPENTAIRFIESGEFLWSTGIFIWRANTIFNKIEEFMFDLAESLHILQHEVNNREKYNIVLDREWELLDSASIDEGVLQNVQRLYALRCELDWAEIDNWDALYKNSPKDENGNAHMGTVYELDSRNNLVYSPNRLTAVVGLEDIVVVSMADTTLVVPRADSNRVKELVKLMKNKNLDEYL